MPCWRAGEDGGALADPDAAGREAAWLADADDGGADDDRAGRGPDRRTWAGTRARLTWKGVTAQAGPHPARPGEVPAADAMAGGAATADATAGDAAAVPGPDGLAPGARAGPPGPLARYKPPTISTGTRSRPHHGYGVRRGRLWPGSGVRDASNWRDAGARVGTGQDTRGPAPDRCTITRCWRAGRGDR